MYESISVRRFDYGRAIVLNRPESGNKIDRVLLHELNLELDEIERDADSRLIILQGRDGVFCTGRDFAEPTEAHSREGTMFARYMETIRRLAMIPRAVISSVDGQVVAGGVGFVVASDLVVATPRSQFSLSETLWGLLPACVTPYLIRRVGFQNAYRMTLTTMPVQARRAFEMNLVDEVSDKPDEMIRQWALRLTRLKSSTIGNTKRFFRDMWMITEETERMAVAEISRLSELPEVKKDIRDFVERRLFPWDVKDPEGT
ncbi:enoyl-CoA hydratase/isomerase family protein [Archangium violaceum]|uniref:enoyl-CoA hydratase-related protein n=1 Tax=Archangium violaceum TaxID=83451 RepID=UPI0019520317|nr:enoyl-CoA hydratase-related protein [Archangium violaceum]QRN93157.1 enoyl-CoA hydratase/isomerase family protein [Archangium violaceum]UQK84957.1 hypothetical protein [Archangium gephyra]